MKKQKYLVRFQGRLNTSIGITYEITDYGYGDTKDEVILSLYDRYEHITNAWIFGLSTKLLREENYGTLY